MNKLVQAISSTVALAAVAIIGFHAQSQVLYENANSPVGNFNNGNGELGNQVSFPGGFSSFLITHLEFLFVFTTLVPTINIQSLSADSFQISWAALSSRGRLYSSADLTPGATWSLVTSRPPESNGSFYVTVPATNAAHFYRVTTSPFGNEMADMRFYKNDGAPSPPSEALSPATLIWDSGNFLPSAAIRPSRFHRYFLPNRFERRSCGAAKFYLDSNLFGTIS